MSKRLQEGEREKERVLAKSEPMINLVSETVERSPMMPSSSASGSQGALRARNQNLGLLRGTVKPVARVSDKKHGPELSNVTIGCQSQQEHRETCGDRKDPNRYWQEMAAQFLGI